MRSRIKCNLVLMMCGALLMIHLIGLLNFSVRMKLGRYREDLQPEAKYGDIFRDKKSFKLGE